MYELIMTLCNILSVVKKLRGTFEIIYVLQIALNMSMPTFHAPDKRGIILLRGLL